MFVNRKGFWKKLLSITICMVYIIILFVGQVGCFAKDRKNGKDNRNEIDENIINESKTDESKTNESKGNGFVDRETKPVFTGERERNIISVEYVPPEYETQVPSYTIKSDLSNIENLEQFGRFTSSQTEKLSRNGFVVTPSNEEQLFYVYENNAYLKIPGFITTDSVLQIYHIFFDYSLRTLEANALLAAIEELTENMLDKSIYLYSKISNPKVKESALKNIAYFAVAMMALEKPILSEIPKDALNMAENEFELISQAQGFDESVIFPFKIDYSQFIPRGHYTRSDDLKRYFRTIMWYGLTPFPLHIIKDGKEERCIEQTVQALLITYSLFLQFNDDSVADNDVTVDNDAAANDSTVNNGNLNSDSNSISDIDLWENIYDPTTFYVGNTDDLNVYHYKDLIIKVYGEDPVPDNFMQEDKIDQIFKEAEKLPEPKIKQKWISERSPVGKQFRFMGQRYIPDSEILQELVAPPERAMPKGLDVMGVLGSDRAYDILINKYQENKVWPGYPEKFSQLKDKFSKIPADEWRSNMYYGWLWVLKSIISPFKEGFPSFMLNEAWVDKSLDTALGSWAQLRHDTILYGKQSGAECGGPDYPLVKSYVEPNVEVYDRLLWLTKYSRLNLSNKGILSKDMEFRMGNFEELLEFLKECSIKELRNEELTDSEYYRLFDYGAKLETLTSNLADEWLRWFEITSETDKNMAVIADVHTVPGEYLEVGVGPAHHIYVVVPIGGKLYLARGAVFSYYEFISKNRLTDEEWQKMLKENKQPPQPEWMKNYMDGPKEELPVPKEPFISPC